MATEMHTALARASERVASGWLATWLGYLTGDTVITIGEVMSVRTALRKGESFTIIAANKDITVELGGSRWRELSAAVEDDRWRRPCRAQEIWKLFDEVSGLAPTDKWDREVFYDQLDNVERFMFWKSPRGEFHAERLLLSMKREYSSTAVSV